LGWIAESEIYSGLPAIQNWNFGKFQGDWFIGRHAMMQLWNFKEKKKAARVAAFCGEIQL
jgi:hypothetical protein